MMEPMRLHRKDDYLQVEMDPELLTHPNVGIALSIAPRSSDGWFNEGEVLISSPRDTVPFNPFPHL